MKTLIVGGVAGGASAAARLRRLDEEAEIILFERGAYISFANCGLPYFVGGTITDKSALTLQTPESFHARFNVDVRVQNEVVSIDKDKKTVTVKDLRKGSTYEESYDNLILSPGAKPILPNIPGVNSSRVFTLRNIPDTYRIKDYVDENKPKSAIVVGAGYIGIEIAENLHDLGIDVAIVELADHVVGPLDIDMAAPLHGHIESKGVTLLMNQALSAIEETSDQLNVTVGEKTLQTDMVIMSVGVLPESDLAGTCGIKTNERGAIVVDNRMRTNIENIYAVGDVIEVTNFVTRQKAFIPLAGPANKQGRIVADNIAGIPTTYKDTQGSSILKCFDMTAATTGINEATAKAANIAYKKTITTSGSHAGYYPGANPMLVKILYTPDTGKLLGAQVVGFDGVDKRADVLATALRAEMTVYDLTELELCYAPPFSSAKDPVNMAGYVAENTLQGRHNPFFWDDVATIDFASSIFIDVRTPEEYEMGHIEGSVNIPVDELREHKEKLSNYKKIYITCQVGLRGHVASRMLMQEGVEVYNLTGGFGLYSAIAKVKNLPKKVTTKETVQ